MPDIGKFYEVPVVKDLSFGMYLNWEGSEILLPRKYVPKGLQIGDTIRVFIYKDSENRPVATTLRPKITLGEFAFLLVSDVNKYGAFLDWGIENELLCPFSEQAHPLVKDRRYVFYLYIDRLTDRLVASSKVEKHLKKVADDGIKVGDEAQLLVYAGTDLGYKVIVRGEYIGLLYDSDIFATLRIGDRVDGRVKFIRPDGKIDVTIRETGMAELERGAGVIIEKLKASNGFLPLTDKSDPEEIGRVLGISKKAFKKASGMLWKEGRISMDGDGIRLGEEKPVVREALPQKRKPERK